MTKFDVPNRTEAISIGIPNGGPIDIGDGGDNSALIHDSVTDVADPDLVGVIPDGLGSGPTYLLPLYAGTSIHDSVTDKESDATLSFHGDNLTAHTEAVSSVHLPDLAAPDLNGFLTENGVDLGKDGSTDPTSQINLGGPDENQGPMSNLPSLTGGNDNTNIPGDLDLNHGDLGVPKGVDLGGDGPLTGVGVPKGIDVDKNDITGVGVPDDINNQGGITGPGVPGGSGHVGVGGFTPGDFDNGHFTDAPDDDRGASAWRDQSSSSYSHGDIFGGAFSAGVAAGREGFDSGIAAAKDGNWAGALSGWAELAVGSAVMVMTAAGAGTDLVTKAVSPAAAADTPTPPANPDPTPNPDPSPNPDPGKGNQPVDDSGTGAHPSTHGTEQPVDDSGTGPVHPLTGTTAQPVDDSGIGPSHPGTHLGAVAVDAPSVASTGLAAASFGGHSAAFWDTAAQHIADSQHATAATANAPAADTSAPVAHNASLGIFEHSAANSFAATAHATDSHANTDATTHIASAHVETEPSHSFGAGLDTSHLALHI